MFPKSFYLITIITFFSVGCATTSIRNDSARERIQSFEEAKLLSTSQIERQRLYNRQNTFLIFWQTWRF